MNSDIELVTKKLFNGEIGIFPSKNGYSVIGLTGIRGVREKIREVKQKKNRRAIPRVIIDVDMDPVLNRYFQTLGKYERDLIVIFKYADVIIQIPVKEDEKNLDLYYRNRGYVLAKNPYERMLLNQLQRPYFASSCNLFGQPTAFSFEEIPSQISDNVSFAFNVGELPQDPDFTVLHLVDMHIRREGKYSRLIKKYIDENIKK